MQILLVDDDDVAVESFRRSMRKNGIKNRISVAEDGQAALEILRNKQVKNAAQPYLVLLDLNMPRMNGFEFLDIVRTDEKLKHTLVFVLTTSSAESDIAAAYEKGISGYFVKSQTKASLSKLCTLIKDFSDMATLTTV